MKTFRKALSIILGLAIMLSCVAGMQVSVAAEGTLALKVGEATIENGVVTVPVVVEEGNPGFQALGVTVGYDANVLKLEEVVKNDNFSDAQNYLPDDGKLTDNGVIGNPEKNPITIMWSYSLVDADITATGTIATLTFNVVEGKDVGTTNIDLEVTQAYNVAEEDLLSITTATDGVVNFPCKHANKTTTTVDAKCIAAGSTTVTCDDCGETLSTQEIPIKEHDYTYTNNGDTHSATCPNGCEGIASEVHTYVDGTCVCGAAEEIPCEHANTEWVVDVEATKDSAGSKHLICSDCGEAIPDSTVEIPRMLRIAARSLTLYSSIAVSFKVDRLYQDIYSDMYVICEYEDLDGVQQTKVLDEPYIDPNNSSRIVFDFKEFAPNQMGNVVKATLYGYNNGELYSGTVDSEGIRTYSILEYCEKYIPQQTSKNKLSRLLVDLLNYGASAQTYTGYKVDALVNDIITNNPTYASWGTTETRPVAYVDDRNYSYTVNDVAEGEKIAWSAAALNLQSAVTMRLRMDMPYSEVDGITVKVTTDLGTTDYINPADDTDPNNPLFADAGSNRTYVYFNKLNAAQFSTKAYFTIYKNGVPVSDTCQYTIETYPARNIGKSGYETISPMLTAMMNYGDSAYYFVNNKEVYDN